MEENETWKTLLAKSLKEARVEKGMRKAELARQVAAVEGHGHCCAASVTNYENGRSVPSAERLSALCKALGLDVKEIMLGMADAMKKVV